MNIQSISREITKLPPEGQQEVFDFVVFLRSRFGQCEEAVSGKDEMKNEPFVGMWADRNDMQDSAGWVREKRRVQWPER